MKASKPLMKAGEEISGYDRNLQEILTLGPTKISFNDPSSA